MSLTGIGCGIAVCVYIHLCRLIKLGKVQQSFTTWVLWGLIEIILAGALIVTHGNYLIALVYALGSLAVSAFLYLYSERKWESLDTFVALLAVVCMVVWYCSGSYNAVIASTTAVVIATIPMLLHCYEQPWQSPIEVYVGFVFSSLLATLGGKTWTVEDRFYPATCFALGVLIVAILSRKYFRNKLR